MLGNLLGLGRGPLTRHDRKLWAAAETLADLGELTAQWLEGRIASQPSYYGTVDVDDAPWLAEALIALNRAGFVTEDSQAGEPEATGYDGAQWRCRADVSGLVADAPSVAWLRRAVAGMSGVEVFADPLVRWPRRPRCAVSQRMNANGKWVTTCSGAVWLTRNGVDDLYDGCSPQLLRVLHGCTYVSIVDMRWGENRIWPALYQAAKGVRR